MLTLKAIRVKNLRSLSDTDFIGLRPITILVGKNSSGKSTFARCFPLLRQSVEAEKRSPVLWYGRLVDFGSFDEAISKSEDGIKNEEIEFQFKISFQKNETLVANAAPLMNLTLRRTATIISPGELQLAIAIKKGESETYASRISLKFFDVECQISLNEDNFISGISTNYSEGYTAWKPKEDSIAIGATDKLIPRMIFFTRKKSSENQPSIGWSEADPFVSDLESAVSYFCHGNTNKSSISDICSKIPLGSPQDVFLYLLQRPFQSTWEYNLKNHGVKSKAFRRLYFASFMKNLSSILESANSSLSSYFSNIRYIEPLRATAQRYYRQQDLAVEEIDPQGANIAMFLESLTPFERTRFSTWLEKLLGFSVQPIREGGHISLKLKPTGSGTPTNIADMGFGYSQVLPIAAQLWASAYRSRRTYSSERQFAPDSRNMVVIEQPELHLHPEYQARLADLFSLAVSKDDSAQQNNPVNLIIETHSPNIINRLGQLVERGTLNKDDVQVIIFDHSVAESKSKITISSFDNEGVLINWPFGFFEPELA